MEARLEVRVGGAVAAVDAAVVELSADAACAGWVRCASGAGVWVKLGF